MNRKLSVMLIAVCTLTGLCGSVLAAVPAVENSKSVTAEIRPDNRPYPISPDLIGIFFEDINYAADGGLYAELIQNRSFEYQPTEQFSWTPFTSWELVTRGGGRGSVAIDESFPIHPNNPRFIVLEVSQSGSGVGIMNPGFDGIPVKAGENYNFSFFARQLYMERRWGGPSIEGRPMHFLVRLENKEGDILSEKSLVVSGRDWKCYSAVMTPDQTENDARLVLLATDRGGTAIDMVSLFPQKTFRSRPNGLRADLAQVIADLEPKFIRFPGGCLVHGNGLGNMYRWKDTIGPVEQRREQANLWGYHQTVGLGYFEYFQFCEDIGAEPLPVVPAAVCCQNSEYTAGMGQKGLPMEEMPAYIQEVLDLIEWANGPADSEWGAKRAAAGHPAPFNLKYLGVGNEDVISDVFKERYKMINDAIRAKYPDIIVIGTTGPAPEGTDYEEGWKFAHRENLQMVDEHGYKSPDWFWENLERFDAYERTGTKVYLGEYAAHDNNRVNTLRSALAEAAYMTSLERNGDLVHLASYAPLLSKQGRTQWRPDMIYFDNVSITPSINYYAQQLFSLNYGDVCLPTTVQIKHPADRYNAQNPNGVLLGAWDTQVEFDNLKVICGNETVLEESFDKTPAGWNEMSGRWRTTDGVYKQSSNDTPALTMCSFDGGKSGYTLTLRARKTAGDEGVLIGFGAINSQNYYWLNLGGWGNTAHRIEKAVNGSRSSIGPSVEGRIESNRWYDIKIQVTGKRIQTWLDGQLLHDMTDRGFTPTPDLAASVVRETKTGDVIIKLVSKANTPITAQVDLSVLGSFRPKASCTVLTGDPMAANHFGRQPQVLPETTEIQISKTFNYSVPPYSLSVIRIRPQTP